MTLVVTLQLRVFTGPSGLGEWTYASSFDAQKWNDKASTFQTCRRRLCTRMLVREVPKSIRCSQVGRGQTGNVKLSVTELLAMSVNKESDEDDFFSFRGQMIDHDTQKPYKCSLQKNTMTWYDQNGKIWRQCSLDGCQIENPNSSPKQMLMQPKVRFTADTKGPRLRITLSLSVFLLLFSCLSISVCSSSHLFTLSCC